MKKTVSIIISAMLMLIMAVPTTAYASSDVASAVSDARSGVLQVEMLYESDDEVLYSLSTGSSFLIGETSGAEYLITSAHVVVLSGDDQEEYSEAIGEDISASDIVYRVVVMRDVYVGATLVNYSSEMDFAILKLDQPIYDREPLVLNDSDDNAISTQTVYALGFPLVGGVTQDVQLYTEEDVTVTTGIVSKKNATDGVNSIHHSAELDYGNSGGPLLNVAGEVIGINQGVVESSSTETSLSEDNISIDIAEVTQVLDSLGIQYTDSDGSSTVVETEESTGEGTEEVIAEEDSVSKSALSSAISAAEAIETEDYTKDTVETFEDALEEAQDIYSDEEATQDDVDEATTELSDAQEALEEASEMNMLLIGGIAAAVVVLILIVILIVALSSSKKKKAKRMQGHQAPPMQQAPVQQAPVQQAPVQQAPVRPVAPTPTPFADTGDNPTTMLNSGAGETGVLGGGMTTATLIRKKNSETITINKQMFKLGKERAKVDYCVADNNSVSRVHAHIILRGNSFVIIDQNTTNFTFVNETKVAPNQEVALKTGDKIKLSDEEFEFRM